jgi:hypothetical protein
MNHLRIPSLRVTLLADALLCLSGGMLLAGYSRELVSLLFRTDGDPYGLTTGYLANGVYYLGLAVLLVGLYVLGVTAGRKIRDKWVWPILMIEIIWIIGFSYLLIRFPALYTAYGWSFMLLAIGVVFLLLVLEWLGLRREKADYLV